MPSHKIDNLAKIVRTIGIIPITLFGEGCASLKDFQKMDSNARAHFVCSRDKSVKQFSSAVSNYSSRVNDIKSALSRGYRTHNSCQQVRVDRPGSISCTSSGPGYNRHTECSQDIETSYENVCTEKRISIDAHLEEKNLIKYEKLMEKAETEKNTAYLNCYSKVEPMSAEEAFNYYKQR